MAQSFHLKLYQFLQRRRRQRRQGFTLIEVLISIAIAGIIVSGLLFLVVQMLKIDREEAVLNETQQDMQRAIDYITRELQQAVFVYPNPPDLAAVTAQLTDLPAGTPVLGFWRTEPIPRDDIAALQACSTEECNVLKLRQTVYSLVVYVLQTNEAGSIWNGHSRIIRYELSPYSDYDPLTARAGYADPSNPDSATGPAPDNDPNSFGAWFASGSTNGTSAVLVDTVDDPTDAAPRDRAGGTIALPQCDVTTNYTRIPPEPAVGDPPLSNSFFVCVRDPEAGIDRNALGLAEDDAARTNQDLVVYLRGDATDQRASGITTFSETSRLPTLESRVLVRGILDKRPQ